MDRAISDILVGGCDISFEELLLLAGRVNRGVWSFLEELVSVPLGKTLLEYQDLLKADESYD